MLCPICKKPLEKNNNSYVCPLRHSYDIAKSGYLNLLINNNNSGDNKVMVNARVNFLSKGYYEKLALLLSEIIAKFNITTALDVGSGEGYFDRIIKKNNPHLKITGVDISKIACDKAKKLSKKENYDIDYVVSSITFLPFSDKEMDAIINIFAPCLESEFERVSSKYIIKVIPSTSHLLELKHLLYEDVYLNEIKDLTFSGFEKILEKDLTYKVNVKEIQDLFQMTPYYYKTKITERITKLESMDITCDFKIFVYKRI